MCTRERALNIPFHMLTTVCNHTGAAQTHTQTAQDNVQTQTFPKNAWTIRFADTPPSPF